MASLAQATRSEDRKNTGTLNAVFFRATRTFDKPDAMMVRVNDRWERVSHRDVERRVRRIALALRALGVSAGERVAILSENRPEWAIVDWACLTSGVTDVPIYQTLPAEQIPYLLDDSGAVAAFVSTLAQARKLASIRRQAPGLKWIITFDEDARPHGDLSLAELEASGTELDTPQAAAAWERNALARSPDDVATLIYTSGTTGPPKGVMLSQGNFHFEMDSLVKAFPVDASDVGLSFLPLSHVFQRVADYYLMSRGVTIAYVDSIDRVPVSLEEVRPTIVCSVPRLYEKMHERVLETAQSGTALRKGIFAWGRGVADRWATAVLAGKRPSAMTSVQYALAQRLVFAKLKARTGGRLKFFVSGGAPLASDINKFFFAAGLTILEGYGLTETTAVIAVNTPDYLRIGTVGRPVEGVEVRIAPDGEILTRGPHVMLGYLNKPDATREAIEADGWFHTGDIGELEDGFLRITDRKKDLIVTAGGKKVAPQPIERMVQSNTFVTQAVMIGDRRKYPILLVVPNFDQLERWAKEHNIIWTDRSQLLAMPNVHAMLDKEVRDTLIGLASFETPKKVAYLGREFSIEHDELTPTLKVKRRVIETKYRDLIDSLYEGSGERGTTPPTSRAVRDA